MAIRRTLAQFSDEIVAADIAANAVGASELADDAVDTAAIATNAVTATEIVAGAITEAKLNADVTDGSAITTSVNPHIIPGKLYPAVAGKLLDGSTSHSGAYGTAQADGFSYYYTDIKGSKPIKDPRIGSHFGSQRYNFNSAQKLEQETATHGVHVYSIDGRENCRASQGGGGINVYNNNNGNYVAIEGDAGFIEVVGYFNDFNLIARHGSGSQTLSVYVNGVQAHSALAFNGTVASPLTSRYVGSGSPRNVDITSSSSLTSNTALGINTIKFTRVAGDHFIYGCELIAQDTTSTATKSQIQIPSQNVVSYGKKFTVSGTPHYDPFNGFTNSTTLHSAVVDTATSLGLSSAPGSSASWAISGSNNIRPYNGGRVVKWVDSTGVIKTSVNMMPPNAQNISTTAAAEITTPSATNTYLPAFSDDAVDHSLAEVAKTFSIFEYGNGNANGGTSGTYKDATMISGQVPIAYVMDDGLTSLTGDAMNFTSNNPKFLYKDGANDFLYLTWIGTGISMEIRSGSGTSSESFTTHIDGVLVDSAWTHNTTAQKYTFGQNLPYGTHILKATSPGSFSSHLQYGDVTFHQPKMPPIPEDAVVISDFMLMADYVKATAGGGQYTSKGVRLISTSRDCFHDTSSGAFDDPALAPNASWPPFGFNVTVTPNQSAGVIKCKLPAFGTHSEIRCYGDRGDLFVDNVDVAGTASGSTYGGLITQDTASTLGSHTFESRNSGTNNHNVGGMGIASPIHTSSHYQTFETPFLHELVGGDRNMEQNNLVVTPDGKTWDQVTRDVSYIGDTVLSLASTTGDNAEGTVTIMDECRGTIGNLSRYWKDSWALGYDRLICLKDGEYRVEVPLLCKSGDAAHIKVNGSQVQYINALASTRQQAILVFSHSFKRGDYVQSFGGYWPNVNYSHFRIYKERN